MKINPILNKEMKIGARSIKMPLIVMLLNSILAFIVILFFYAYGQVMTSSGIDLYSLRSVVRIFKILGWVEICFISVAVPIFAASSISGERERQTLDIMLTTSAKPMTIIVGKLTSSVLTILLFIVSTIPVLSLSFVYGGSVVNKVFGLIAILMVAILYFGSIGILTSSFCRNSIGSIILALVFEGLLVFGTLVVLGLIALVVELIWQIKDLKGTADLGYTWLLLLVNPFVTFYEYISKATGGNAEILREIIDTNAPGMEWILKNWLFISCGVQILLSFLNLKLASVAIRRTRGQKVKKKNKKSKKNQPVEEATN
ncbi:MAG: ABC transporter permease subunit [Lachnospiraceae bacterium]|nr:ABC transporter permease subunit [Lachnospiraceae bacterium]MEE1341865.1 ABC transporter permease subunit [Lachnospiraceae bacterium]